MARTVTAGSELMPSEALRRRYTETKHIWWPTVSKKVFVKTLEESPQPQMSMREAAALGTHVALFWIGKQAQEKAAAVQERRRQKLIRAAGRFGLRGVANIDRKATAAIYPDTKITWDPEKLEDRLEARFPDVVERRIQLELTLPSGSDADIEKLSKKIQKKTRRAAAKMLDLSKGDVKPFVSVGSVVAVHEERLFDLMSRGLIADEDIDEAAAATETWYVKSSPLPQNLNRALATMATFSGTTSEQALPAQDNEVDMLPFDE